MVRRGLALVGALCLVLSPGAVGLVRVFASLDVCGCNMGPDCPMCKARRAKEKKEVHCPCRMQQQGPIGDEAPGNVVAFDFAFVGSLAVDIAPSPAHAPLDAQGLATVWAPDVPHPPPRA